ncbi:hypothetical protein OG426_25430 [Streptomyces canus]|uniref:hypothetical protein n=1 Tax=Streptomyces canus TaxID=58343 RepID=UPI0022599ACB|nr:hypothetical protein [Streptomyces canus]MCX4859185.1 hypothetical protein [Streptomyces canus]WSW35578.1 hypothetical protein OG426_25430 [Streptomyces canus]
MTNQPYEDYEQYPQQGWPAQQGYDDDAQAAQQHTQQWQGQTWDTQVHRPVQAAPETAYLPQQDYEAGPQGYGPGYGPAQGAPGAGAYGSAAAPDPAYGPSATSGPAPYGSAPASPDRAGHGHASTAPGHAGHAHAPASAGPVHGSAQAHPGAAAPADPASDPSGYGPATLAGNARVTDAQRARLEGRSPIIEPGIQPAALTALLGLLLSGTAAVGSYALLVPLVVLQAVTAAGWFRLNGMWPARQGIALAFLGALVADAALLVAGRENAPAAILGTLGVWVLLSLVMQLRSHADPDERMYGLMATVASAALAIVATGHLAADPDAVTVGAAAVAVAVLARALPLPTPASVVVSLLAAAGAGIAVGGMTGLGAKGALLGAGAAVCALIGHRVASYDYPSRFVHFTAGVALPLAAAAPAVYVLGRAIG